MRDTAITIFIISLIFGSFFVVTYALNLFLRTRTKKYDDDIVRSIPGHEELHMHIDQVQWLREVGFRGVQVVYQEISTALVYAEK